MADTCRNPQQARQKHNEEFRGKGFCTFQTVLNVLCPRKWFTDMSLSVAREGTPNETSRALNAAVFSDEDY